jgi:hypothetical protein
MATTKKEKVPKSQYTHWLAGLGRNLEEMTKILFVCHGSISKSPEKA